MDEVAGRIESSVVTYSGRKAKVRFRIIRDTGGKIELGIADALSNIRLEVGSSIWVRHAGGVIYEILDIDGSPPDVYYEPHPRKTNIRGTVGQNGIAGLVIVAGILMILAGFTNLQYVGAYILLGILQIAVGYALFETLSKQVAFLAFLVNLCTFMVWLIGFGTSSLTSVGGAYIGLALLFLQTSLICIFVCPASMDKYS